MRFILSVLSVLLLVSIGCKSDQSDRSKAREKINQFDRNGKKQGPWKEYSDNNLIAEGSYDDGQRDGLWIIWYKNGQKKEEGHYSGGEKQGMWTQWNEDGTLMWKGLWENGKRIIEYTGEPPEILFIGQNTTDKVLIHDTSYQVRIRVPNVPASHLYVEVSNGSISKKEEESDLFVLNTSDDSTLIMAIGYMPDLEFKDFRNLVREIQFMVK